MSTQAIEERADTQEDTQYVREVWQDKLTDSSWTITEEEAQELLSKAERSAHPVLQAMDNTVVFLRRKNQKPSDYYPEELLVEVSNQIRQIARGEDSRSAAPRDPDGKRVAPRSVIAELIKEFSQRIPGYAADEAEVLSFFELAKGRTNLVLQSMRTVGAFVKSRIHTVLTHDDVIQRVLGKIAHEMKLVKDFTQKTNTGAKNANATNCRTF